MKRFSSAIAGGVAGTAVMSLLLLLLEVETRSALKVFYVIARFIGTPDDPAVGFALFAVAGTVAWPLLFLALEPYLPRGPDPAARGVVFASILWLPFVITGRGDIGGPLLVFFGAYTLFAHWAYGFTLGAVYGRLFRPA
ncbi:hypothetical protein SAMN05444422_104149 [Halobiforma haloterrestris]|uniref:Uncharacterized protein n=1 Tax=Natronobacterium haloterrestre TaxID=148448 RepID=A0A1I1G8B5_NATHA|nr:DUF6789 family protein [Halobiforma haloterrestris]SFC07781.1 hypothetical protein SAMN05444422_104149 [Halobiforma haloterrestris]